MSSKARRESITCNYWKVGMLRSTDDIGVKDMFLPENHIPKHYECYEPPIQMIEKSAYDALEQELSEMTESNSMWLKERDLYKAIAEKLEKALNIELETAIPAARRRIKLFLAEVETMKGKLG